MDPGEWLNANKSQPRNMVVGLKASKLPDGWMESPNNVEASHNRGP